MAENCPEWSKPIVIAHRGASGYRPEHTLASYTLAIKMGADFIEPDLVPTKDGHLIARHENELSSTTNVSEAKKFARRKTTKTIDGDDVTGWFSEDFTLAEIKSLKARERIPDIRPKNTRYNDKFEIPTFEEVIALAKKHGVGVYPETKHPTYFLHEGCFLDGKNIHFDISEALVKTLVAEAFTDANKVFIQSFEIANLIALKNDIMPRLGAEFPLIQLMGDTVSGSGSFAQPRDVIWYSQNPEGLKAVYGPLMSKIRGGISAETHYGDLAKLSVLQWMKKHYACGIGPWKDSLLPKTFGEGGMKYSATVAPLLTNALKVGLDIHPYTLRAEPSFLSFSANGSKQSVAGEIMQLLSLGVTGFFTDNADEGVRARDIFVELNGL